MNENGGEENIFIYLKTVFSPDINLSIVNNFCERKVDSCY